LAMAHREIFVSLALCPLKDLVLELERYVRTGCAEPTEFLRTWNELGAYRILPPMHDDPLTIKLFESNVKIALAIAARTWMADSPSQGPQSASQLP